MQVLESGCITSINLKAVEVLAETFRKNPERHIQWLIECSKYNEWAKSLTLLIILQALVIHYKGNHICNLCFPIEIN